MSATASETNRESLSVWNDIATYWDANYGKDGNLYWKALQEPSIERLLADKFAKVKTGEVRALDLATGNGIVARLMAAHGAHVLATDGSDAMLSIAAGHVGEGLKVAFRKLDVTSDDDFERLVGEEEQASSAGFDIVTINMAIMDIPTIEPLVRALPKLLAKDGVFMATILHPVFTTNNAARKIEIDFDKDGKTRVTRSKVITEYLSVPPYKGWALPDQPKMQSYFHRPMGDLFSTFFGGGLVMDGMEELAFTEEHARHDRVESTVNFTQLPAILSWRMRRAN
ncbi:S-adenosyl-L-methionine-dependent methyltransferase [Podospora aff. communis PSN243]|uniref:S-adenosyl-L-methionine-dependent methyltransferase n=1 Tax=Podospora aff. communis PSN243 TaxID=3040156 RepID=A0AAV9GJJ4_9PEZI|nr:S-adenosyl-L-methionine-dependent methyltransferase [Podospora aff. communis PSN243]